MMLLVETLKRLKDVCRLAAAEGDEQTSLDADRVRATGVAAVQVNTAKAVTWMCRWFSKRWRACQTSTTGCSSLRT